MSAWKDRPAKGRRAAEQTTKFPQARWGAARSARITLSGNARASKLPAPLPRSRTVEPAGKVARISCIGFAAIESPQRQKIPQDDLASICQDRFRMELHALHRQLFVPQSHDQDIRRGSGDFERCRQRVLLDDERVIARGCEILRDALRDGLAVVMDPAALPVDQ